MRVDWLKIGSFKNLHRLEIDFDEGELSTVLIGENGTGKSNVLEAIVAIFRGLDLGEPVDFSYAIAYVCKGHRVEIDQHYGNPDKVSLLVDGQAITRAGMDRRREELLPNYVFGYYSGGSRRLEALFDKHQERYYQAIIRPGAEETTQPRQAQLRRLFYCRPNYGPFALLSYFAFGTSSARSFLEEHLGILGFDSALLVLKEPWWAKARITGERRKKGDHRFWYAAGIVRQLLDAAWENSLAPIRHKEKFKEDYRSNPQDEDRVYLFIRDEKSLQRMAEEFGEEKAFFAYLESLDISDLVRDVRIWVHRKGAETELPFHEISDGEKQLLGVLGLMRFTGHEESLFLLDEPDTHLNPSWKWGYLQLVKQVAGENPESHLIMTSHDPLTIAGLKASQIQVMYSDEDKIRVRRPDVDPRGLGVTGILTQIFGLATTLDPETQQELDERNQLLSLEKRTRRQQVRLKELTEKFNQLGFLIETREPDYEKFLRAFQQYKETQHRSFTPEEIQAQNELALRLVRELQGEDSR